LRVSARDRRNHSNTCRRRSRPSSAPRLLQSSHRCIVSFFYNVTATTETYTLSLHDALPISKQDLPAAAHRRGARGPRRLGDADRSEEHTSELQSREKLVCRLLLEKKKQYCKQQFEQANPIHDQTDAMATDEHSAL